MADKMPGDRRVKLLYLELGFLDKILAEQLLATLPCFFNFFGIHSLGYREQLDIVRLASGFFCSLDNAISYMVKISADHGPVSS